MNIDGLQVLEDKIDDVLNRHVALSQERDRLQEELGQAQARIDAMAGQLRAYEKERDEIKVRVERIMTRLDALGLN